jgi:hypothetical protein
VLGSEHGIFFFIIYYPTLYWWATVSPQFKLDLSKVTKWDWNYSNVCHDFGHTWLFDFNQVWQMLNKYDSAHYKVLTLKQARALLANTFIKFTRAGERTQDLKKIICFLSLYHWATVAPLLANVTLGWKNFSGTNTLAYFVPPSATDKEKLNVDATSTTSASKRPRNTSRRPSSCVRRCNALPGFEILSVNFHRFSLSFSWYFRHIAKLDKSYSSHVAT